MTNEATRVTSHVTRCSNEVKKSELYGRSGFDHYEFRLVVKGTYESGNEASANRLDLEKNKMLMQVKKDSLEILRVLSSTMERNLAVLRRERRELLRANALQYRMRLRRRTA